MRKSGAKTPLSVAALALKILRRSRHQHALDPLPIEMTEVAAVASQQIAGLAVNRDPVTIGICKT